MSNTDKVFIRDLEIDMSVGIYDHERKNKQRVIINIAMNVKSNAGKELCSIKDVISYEEIINSVTELAQDKHYDLLEEFAEDLANLCLKSNKVVSTSIKVEKLDIIKECQTVGIEIIRPIA